MAYVRAIAAIGSLDRWNVIFVPKFFDYLSKENNNADIARYRGYAEWTAILGKNDNLSIALIGRTGSHFDRGSIEANMTYPIHIPAIDMATFAIVQWFEGYGESILNYNHRSYVFFHPPLDIIFFHISHLKKLQTLWDDFTLSLVAISFLKDFLKYPLPIYC